MAGEHRAAVTDAHLMRVGEHRQHATNIRMGYRIVIQIEADIGRFADANGNALEQRRRVVGQRQQARRFLDEHLADATFEVFGTASVGGLSIAPGLSLDIEIIKIGERASREERITYVTYGSLHAAFFVPACHRHRAGFITVVSGKAEQCRMEANRIAASFQDCTLEIIVEQNTRYALPCFEGGDVAAQEVLHASVKEEAQKDLTRVAQHHDERHQRTACSANFEISEMTPLCREPDYAE
jgi:hypothetical protein